MSAPARNSRLVASVLSSSVIPAAGAAISAEAPPESRHRKRSPGRTDSASASALLPARSLPAVGSGCPPTTTLERRRRIDWLGAHDQGADDAIAEHASGAGGHRGRRLAAAEQANPFAPLARQRARDQVPGLDPRDRGPHDRLEILPAGHSSCSSTRRISPTTNRYATIAVIAFAATNTSAPLNEWVHWTM